MYLVTLVLLLPPFQSSHHRLRPQMTNTRVECGHDAFLTDFPSPRLAVDRNKPDGWRGGGGGEEQEQQQTKRSFFISSWDLGRLSTYRSSKKFKRVLQLVAMFSNFQFAERSYYVPLNPLCPWNIDYFSGIFGWVVSKTVVVAVTQINDLSTLV